MREEGRREGGREGVSEGEEACAHPHEEQGEADKRVFGGCVEGGGTVTSCFVNQGIHTQHQHQLQVEVKDNVAAELRGGEALGVGKEEGEGDPEPEEGADEPTWPVQYIKACVPPQEGKEGGRGEEGGEERGEEGGEREGGSLEAQEG